MCVDQRQTWNKIVLRKYSLFLGQDVSDPLQCYVTDNGKLQIIKLCGIYCSRTGIEKGYISLGAPYSDLRRFQNR